MPHRWLVTLDSYANETYGRGVSASVADGVCAACGRVVESFGSRYAEHQYGRVGLCETCLPPREPRTVVPFRRPSVTPTEP